MNFHHFSCFIVLSTYYTAEDIHATDGGGVTILGNQQQVFRNNQLYQNVKINERVEYTLRIAVHNFDTQNIFTVWWKRKRKWLIISFKIK